MTMTWLAANLYAQIQLKGIESQRNYLVIPINYHRRHFNFAHFIITYVTIFAKNVVDASRNIRAFNAQQSTSFSFTWCYFPFIHAVFYLNNMTRTLDICRYSAVNSSVEPQKN